MEGLGAPLEVLRDEVAAIASALSVWGVVGTPSSLASSARTGVEMPAAKSTLAVPRIRLRQVIFDISQLLPDHVGTFGGRTPI